MVSVITLLIQSNVDKKVFVFLNFVSIENVEDK